MKKVANIAGKIHHSCVSEFVDCNDYYLYISLNELQQKAFHSIYMYKHFSLTLLNQHYLYHHY